MPHHSQPHEAPGDPEPPATARHRALFERFSDPPAQLGGTETERWLRAITDNANGIIWIKDLNGQFRYVNQYLCALLEKRPEELLGRTVHEIFPADIAGEYARTDEAVLSTGVPMASEETIARPEGRQIFLASRFPLYDSGGSIGALGAIYTDITRRAEAEEAHAQLAAQLHQAQKLDSIGRLAGGVAHDFNNLLTVIRGYCDIIRDKLRPEDPVHEDLEQIKLAGDRAAELTRRLLAFSRKQALTPTVLDLNFLIAQLRAMLERIIGEDITLVTSLQSDLWPVTADSSQIEQVIMNLVINAREAMPTGGTLTIETCNISQPGDGGSGEARVLITVTDTGCGMDRYVQSRIFEPFFTTKAHSEGTGLGLATVYGVVTQSGGQITVSSTPGVGTTFHILLPASTSESAAVSHAEVRAAVRGGHETVLLVEDDEQVRRLANVALLGAGYSVVEASSAAEALQRCQAHHAPIELLITDVVLPHTSGRALAEQLTALRPAMRVLFISGHSAESLRNNGLLPADVPFMPKPFTPFTLAARVRDSLDSLLELKNAR